MVRLIVLQEGKYLESEAAVLTVFDNLLRALDLHLTGRLFVNTGDSASGYSALAVLTNVVLSKTP